MHSVFLNSQMSFVVVPASLLDVSPDEGRMPVVPCRNGQLQDKEDGAPEVRRSGYFKATGKF